MTMLGRGRRDAADKARKAEKARQKADEAARKAAEAAEEAEQAAREAEAEAAEAENGSEGDAEATAGAKGAGKPETDGKAATRPTKAPKSEPKPAPKPAAKPALKAAPKTDPDPEPAPEEPAAEAADVTEADGAEPEAGAVKTAEAEDADGPADGEPTVALTKKPARKAAGAEDDENEDERDENDAADDADEDDDPAVAEVAQPAKRKAVPSRRGPRTVGGLRPAGWVLVVVNVALVAALVWVVMALQGVQDEDKQAMDKVAFAASRAAEDLSSYDYRTIDADLKRATGHTTGKFRGEFDKLSTTVKPSAVEGKTVVEGTAVKTAVESIDGDKAIALVYLNQQTAKGTSGERTPNQYSVRLVLKKVGDRWMVSELQMV